MFKWAVVLLGLALGVACLSAVGVGAAALLKLALALLAMTAVALLIARPFLRHKPPL